jgi:hypothetical protein
MRPRFVASGLAVVLAFSGLAQAALIDVTTPGDAVIGLNDTVAGGANTLSTAGTGPGQYPAAETPPMAIDNNQGAKYLNFGGPVSAPGVNTGFYVTPSIGPTIVTGLRFSTANDSPDRDPLTFTLEGTTGDPATAAWSLIASSDTGLLSDPGRNTWQSSASQPFFVNVAAYTSYRLLFPTVRGSGQNSMQIGEVEILGAPVPEPSTFVLLGMGAIGLLAFGWRRWQRA